MSRVDDALKVALKEVDEEIIKLDQMRIALMASLNGSAPAPKESAPEKLARKQKEWANKEPVKRKYTKRSAVWKTKRTGDRGAAGRAARSKIASEKRAEREAKILEATQAAPIDLKTIARLTNLTLSAATKDVRKLLTEGKMTQPVRFKYQARFQQPRVEGQVAGAPAPSLTEAMNLPDPEKL